MDVSNSSVALKQFVISPNDDVDDDNDNNDFGFDYYHLNHPFNPLLVCVCVCVRRARYVHPVFWMKWYHLSLYVLMVNPVFQSMWCCWTSIMRYHCVLALFISTFSQLSLNAYRFYMCFQWKYPHGIVLFPICIAILSEFSHILMVYVSFFGVHFGVNWEPKHKKYFFSPQN